MTDMMKRYHAGILLLLLALLAVLPPAFGSPRKERRNRQASDSLKLVLADSLTDAFLDTVNIKKALMINDYSMIGVQWGVGLNKMTFNPPKKQTQLVLPGVYGIMYTRYGKMFGYMPYFGVQVGAFYGQDGYQFKKDEEGYTPSVDGATHTVYDYIEIPALAHFHVDVWHFKLMAGLGCYGGYRLKVHREGYGVPDEYKDNFYDYDRRLDYGLKGGGGIGFFLDPVELHLTAMVRYGLGSLYDPDYYSQYYYRFATPFDIVISAGLHFQLTKRTGKTRAALRREAYERVFPPEETVAAEAARLKEDTRQARLRIEKQEKEAPQEENKTK